MLLVYSPIGGSGKTSVALGLSRCLADENKRVLYLNLEQINTFQIWMNNQAYLADSGYSDFRNGSKEIFTRIRHQIRNEGFDYLPPFKASLSALGIELDVFMQLIQNVKEMKNYDFIIIDTDAAFSESKAELMKLANRVFLLTMQDQVSVFKMDVFLNNVNCNDPEKYMFICSRYNQDQKNYLKDEKKKNYTVGAYIYEAQSHRLNSCENISKIGGLRDLAFILL